MLCRRSDTDTNANSHGDPDTDAVYGEMFTDTAPAPDTAPATERGASHLSGGNSERDQLVMHYLPSASRKPACKLR